LTLVEFICLIEFIFASSSFLGYTMSTLRAETPMSVSLLGYGGLLPFALLTLALWAEPADSAFWTLALVSYGAVILSFVGAIHWGIAMMSHGLAPRLANRRFMWSVVPSLVGWSATLLPPQMGVWLLVAGFALHYWQDHLLQTHTTLPRWYLPLRRRLSVVACLSLVVASWVL
jgi:hypothetical protein